MKTTTFKKGALFSAVAMLLVAVIALTTASFAWFTASLNPTMTDFNITASAANALLISADKDTGYLTYLDYADLKAVTSNILPEKASVNTRMLNASTPVGGNASNKLTLDNGIIKFMAAKEGTKFAGNYAATGADADDYLAVAADAKIADEAADTIRFIKFDLYFKSTVSEAGSMGVYLDNTRTKDIKVDFTAAGGVGMENAGIAYDGTSFIHSYEVDKTPVLGTAQREIAKVLRVAFVSSLLDDSGNVISTPVNPVTYVPDSSDGASKGAGVVDTDMAYTTDEKDSEWTKMQKALIDNMKTQFFADWDLEKQSDYATNGYFTFVDPTYTITQKGKEQRDYDFGKYLDNPKAAVKLSSKIYCAAVDLVALKADSNKYDQEAYVETTKGNKDVLLFDGLANNKRAKTTVYLWIEGNDAECNNIVAAANFMAAFKFRGIMA